MFKINHNVKQSYAEIPQKNPLRWVMLHRTGKDTFDAQTGDIKCKDFFNDTLAFFKSGMKFGVYGYQSEKLKNEEGVYFLLKFISDKGAFRQGIDTINQKMKEQLGEELTLWDHEKDQMIVLLPPSIWESTWRLSLVTFLIRCSNYGYAHKSWDDFWHSQAPMYALEHTFDDRTKKNTKTWGFLVPKPYAKYWYFCGKDFNSEKAPRQTGGTIHNNGCVNWSTFMSQEGVTA